VHLLVIYPPKVRPSELVNSLKGVSTPAPEGRVPSHFHLLARAKERGRAMVPELFRWLGWRRPFGSTSRTKGALTPRRERRGPSRYSVDPSILTRQWRNAFPVTDGDRAVKERFARRARIGGSYRAIAPRRRWGHGSRHSLAS